VGPSTSLPTGRGKSQTTCMAGRLRKTAEECNKLNLLSPVTPPERSGRFAKEGDKCLSAASFCHLAKRLRSEGNPKGKELGRLFSASSLWANKERKSSFGDETPRFLTWLSSFPEAGVVKAAQAFANIIADFPSFPTSGFCASTAWLVCVFCGIYPSFSDQCFSP